MKEAHLRRHPISEITDIARDIAAVPGTKAQQDRSGWLFGPVLDFLLLGGGASLIALIVVMLLPEARDKQMVLLFLLVLGSFVNHPHFAHSYQIFYRDYRRKILSADYGPALRFRYFFAGMVVPLILAGFFIAIYRAQNLALLGASVNVMFFFVGWHYVKQGYGMAIVDSVLKRKFYSEREKKILLWNSYICWLFTWLIANAVVTDRNYLGAQYYALPVPKPLLHALVAATIASGLLMLILFALKARRDGRRTPFNGMAGYFSAIYLWLLAGAFSPVYALIVPAFHSLQYNIVVWRYQLNSLRDLPPGAAPAQPVSPGQLNPAGERFLLFLLAGFLIGLAGFWGAPLLLTHFIVTPAALRNCSVFVLMFWVTINIHHYFMDNVIWRKENQNVRKYLFSPPSNPA